MFHYLYRFHFCYSVGKTINDNDDDDDDDDDKAYW